MAEHLKLINDERPASHWGPLVMTDTSKEILRSLSHIAGKWGAIKMVAAVPGAEKSETILRYQKNSHDTILVQIVAGEGKARDVVPVLCDASGIAKPEMMTLSEQRRYIGNIIGECSTLLVDEAQYLVI